MRLARLAIKHIRKKSQDINSLKLQILLQVEGYKKMLGKVFGIQRETGIRQNFLSEPLPSMLFKGITSNDFRI